MSEYVHKGADDLSLHFISATIFYEIQTQHHFRGSKSICSIQTDFWAPLLGDEGDKRTKKAATHSDSLFAFVCLCQTISSKQLFLLFW